MTDRNRVKGTNAVTPGGRRLTVGQIVAIALAVLAAIFIAQNRQDATVSLLFITVTLPLWITLACATAVGWLLHRRSTW